MSSRSDKSIVLAIAIGASVWTVAAKEAVAADVFTLKSSTFEDGKMMPKKVANSAGNTKIIQTALAITCRQNSRGAMCRKGPRAL